MSYKVDHFINGQLSARKKSQYQAIDNPATGKVIGQVAFADKAEVEMAVAAAKAVYPAWSETPVLKRARILFKFKELLEKNIELLAKLVTQEHGKVIADAKGSVMRGIEVVEFCCGMPNLLQGSFSENVSEEMDCYTVHQSLGVCAGITPFNFPVMVPIWMFVPAIACGNTFVLKPSEKDPSAPLLLAELMQEAGLPKGVLNIINGEQKTVESLITHPDVVAVSCVGSTPVAKSIYQTAIHQGKRAQAFGGAKNHCIVMPDADMHEAATAIAGAAFGAAGERCMALSAVITVGDKVADQLIQQLKKDIEKIHIAPGTDSKSQMGPLVTKEHRQCVLDYINLGVKEGANLIIDGRELTIKNYEQGYFLGPSLFDQVESNMCIYQEEIFGPVLVVLRVKDFDEALALVNQHEYGNGTTIFTRDGNCARTFAAKVQVGMVGINVPIPVPVAYHRFGGWKNSVFGDIGLHAKESMQFYTQAKSVSTRWPKGIRESSFHMPTH